MSTLWIRWHTATMDEEVNIVRYLDTVWHSSIPSCVCNSGWVLILWVWNCKCSFSVPNLLAQNVGICNAQCIPNGHMLGSPSRGLLWRQIDLNRVGIAQLYFGKKEGLAPWQAECGKRFVRIWAGQQSGRCKNGCYLILSRLTRWAEW